MNLIEHDTYISGIPPGMALLTCQCDGINSALCCRNINRWLKIPGNATAFIDLMASRKRERGSEWIQSHKGDKEV